MIRRAARVLVASSLCLSACQTAEELPVIDIGLGNYFYHGPDTIPAGRVSFRLHLTGPDGHVMDVVRLEGGKTIKDVLAAGIGVRDSAWVVRLGGGMSGPESSTPVYTATLTPGRYVLLCYFRDPDHLPHWVKGMIKQVIVTPSRRGAPATTPDLEVRMVDYAFQLSAPVKAGLRTIAVINPSVNPHEMIVARLKEGQQLAEALADPDYGHPTLQSPWQMIGGVGDLHPGDTIFMSASFPAGTYQLTCYFGTRGDSMSHFMRGMHQVFTVN